MYTAQWFKQKFQAIPEKQWGIASLIMNCVLSICGTKADNNGEYILSDEGKALCDLIYLLKLETMSFFMGNRTHQRMITVYHLNDGVIKQYQQLTPKQRILAAIEDVIKIQEANKPKIKHIYHSVSTDRKVRESVKEMCYS